ncbi:MAG: hypothetical protein DRO11_04740 [Methanobacteriota archaeon]|nr:MAG: hypothetical protein DRO11_04740 [Euryarchaeota archaeon]
MGLGRAGDSLDRSLLLELILLNKHLPRERKTLGKLLEEEKPNVVGYDGNKHFFRREELILLSSMLDRKKVERLELPIYIELTTELGRGTSRIVGELACEVVAKLLGLPPDRQAETGSIHLYRYEVRELRRKLPTTTQYMFSRGRKTGWDKNVLQDPGSNGWIRKL